MDTKAVEQRMERAKDLKVYKWNDGLYFVESSNKEKMYKVRKEGDVMTCGCPDFTRHGGEDVWKCKHILTVEHFSENHEVLDVCQSSRQCAGLNRKLLEAPFEDSLIKQRKGAFGDVLDYVEGHAVIRRLNDAFEGKWSFEVLDHKVMDEEVVVLAKLEAGGISKTQFGRSRITRAKEDNSLVSLGDDLKAAATDALKKAATHFGVGLHLYEEKNALGNAHGSQPKVPSGGNDGNPAKGNQTQERLTNRQLTTIYSIAKDKGICSKEMEQRILNAFGKRPEYLSKQQASDVIKQLKEIGQDAASGVKEREADYES